jgi:hypothetical protein
LLDEEMQEDERRATETRNTYLDEALAMLRTWPDTHFLTYNDLEHYAMKVDPKATHSQPGAESVFDILRKAACTRYKVDPDAEKAVTGLRGESLDLSLASVACTPFFVLERMSPLIALQTSYYSQRVVAAQRKIEQKTSPSFAIRISREKRLALLKSTSQRPSPMCQ